jgi:hypothetical protein
MNGYCLSVKADASESFLIRQLIQNKIELEDMASWLETAMKKVS